MAEKKGAKGAGSENRPEQVPLEPMDFLQFENLWLRVKLARQELAAAEANLEGIRRGLAARYGLTGTWRLAPERRAFVPCADDAGRISPTARPQQAEVACGADEKAEGGQDD